MATVSPHPATIQVASIKNILFATDFSEASMKAFPYVELLAKKFGASVLACFVITPNSLVVAAPEGAPYLYQAEYDVATRELDNILTAPQLRGIKTNAAVVSGILGDALLDKIHTNKIDLIVAGTHGRTGFRRFLLGSAVEEICRVATCPVLTVGPEPAKATTTFSRILVPTDLSEESMSSLPIVMRLAAEYGSSITVLHVLPEETANNPDAKVLSEPIYKKMVHLFEPYLGAVKADFVIESGETADTILKVAAEKGTDLIAMGIRSAFLPGFQVRASVAYRVIAAANCPVVTCR